MRVVAPFGFYGWGNIGDEATLNGFAQLLAGNKLKLTVSVGSRNPQHTASVEPAFRYFSCRHRDPRRWVAKLFGNAHAIIGGTPIMDVEGEWPLCELAPLVRSIDRWRVPLAFIGIGTETLRLEKSRRIVAEEIAPRASHWSVRCARDRERLTQCGVTPDSITVAADMAWLIDRESDAFGRKRLREWGLDSGSPLIGVNLVNENALFDRHPAAAAALAEALDGLTERLQARILFLSNDVREDENFDKAAALKVIGRMKRTDRILLAPNHYFTPRQMMSIIACCNLTLSMRYHFCLLSAAQSVPFIAIERSDKIADLCWDMNWAARVEPRNLAADELIGHGIRLVDHKGIAEQLKQVVQSMRERAQKNLKGLSVLGLSQVDAAIG